MDMSRRDRKRQLVVEDEYWALILAGVGTVDACDQSALAESDSPVWLDSLTCKCEADSSRPSAGIWSPLRSPPGCPSPPRRVEIALTRRRAPPCSGRVEQRRPIEYSNWPLSAPPGLKLTVSTTPNRPSAAEPLTTTRVYGAPPFVADESCAAKGRQ